jgi:hypothetical protein
MGECRQCPNGSTGEWYRFVCFEWDVKKARQFASGHEEHIVSTESLRKMGLPVDGEPQWQTDENGRKFKTISALAYVSEEHLKHIPAEKLLEPVLLAPLLCGNDRSMLLIDGRHRATILARQGKEVRCLVLTDAESLACMNIGPADRKKFKVFSKVKPALLKGASHDLSH